MNMNMNMDDTEFFQILESLGLSKFLYLLEDNKNILYIEEVIVCSKQEVGMFLDMFKLETEIEEINEGNYSININGKYVIVFESIKLQLKDLVHNFLFKLKNNLKEKIFPLGKISVFEYLKNIVTFVNFVLLFSPEFSTLYNLKKQILLEMKFKKFNCDDLIFSEFLFVNILNEKFRKCSISWDYRFFLIKNFDMCKSFPVKWKKIADFTYEEKISVIWKKFSNISEIFKKKSILENTRNKFLLLDLYHMEKINENQKRNYHLWKYLVHLFDLHTFEFKNNLSEIFLIYSFCLVNFIKNPLDYSAYSNLINFHKKLKYYFTREEIDDLKSHLIKIKNYQEEDKNLKYLKDFIEIHLN